MQALFRYLSSTGNLVGSSAALAVLVAYFTGFIHSGWGLLAAGAYCAGALPFAFRDPPELLHVDDGLSTSEALQQLKRKMLPKIPAHSGKVLAEIITRVEGLMPRLKEMEAQGTIEAASRAMLKQTVTRLLPDAIENYLRLPSKYAQSSQLSNGKTAQEILHEQLILLNEHVITLEENLLSADVNSLLANGQFLQEKLQPGIKLFD